MKVMRNYTGTADGIAKGERPGLRVLVAWLERQSERALWNNGTFANRAVRGKSSLSVHATGRAADLSYRKMEKKGKVNGRKHAVRVMDFLVKNADKLGIELIIDYYPEPYGRTWRCDRNAWKKYITPTVSGAPHGDWIHIEISPAMADNPEQMEQELNYIGALPPLSDFGASS